MRFVWLWSRAARVAMCFAWLWNRAARVAPRFDTVPTPVAGAVHHLLNGCTYPYYKSPAP